MYQYGVLSAWSLGFARVVYICVFRECGGSDSLRIRSFEGLAGLMIDFVQVDGIYYTSIGVD